ncbi:hypothetical protein AXK11_02640 [Cephaloticoccus primus]|uniref:DMT family transporter n=1 Tax=Cephaloticoccus primus TaxID=1548207 RepID=A0A139SRW7_9BACT|nr:DMT family transporter [Cephaloticoccus primus]KXU37220.1 hypothetical protein AXK11_02640 [Cephaloticoccus primus]
MNTPLTTVALASVALTAGALVSYQAGANATLGRALGHPLWATLVSLSVSILVAIPVMLAMRVPAPSVSSAAAQLPAWAWLGGIAGVIYVTSALLLTPKMGATNFIVCVVAGQILASLIIDHYGLVGMPVREINLGRCAGAALIFIGMIVVQWFTPRSQ